MRSPIPDYLQHVLDDCSDDGGHVADYIPELAAADPERFGVVIATLDGEMFSAGDVDVEFSIQSISKPFTYGLAIEDNGLDRVLELIDVEPSGDAFNEISLDPESGRPRNPMINAGAIASHALVKGGDAETRADRILDLYSRLAGRQLGFDEGVFSSELETANRNNGHRLHAPHGRHLVRRPRGRDPRLHRQCSISVTATDLARMAAVLAANGRNHHGDQIIDPAVTPTSAERDGDLRHVRLGRRLVDHGGHPGQERGRRWTAGCFARPARHGSCSRHSWTTTATATAACGCSNGCRATWSCTLMGVAEGTGSVIRRTEAHRRRHRDLRGRRRPAPSRRPNE